MTGLYQFTVLCTHTEAVPHCKKLAAWCSTQWADRYANIPSQCRQHHSSLSPHFSLLTPSAAQLQKSISHINQAKAWELNGPREHGDHPDTPPPGPLGCLSPQEPTAWSTVPASPPRHIEWVLIGGGRECHRCMSLWFSACRPICERQTDASCEISKSIFFKSHCFVYNPVS